MSNQEETNERIETNQQDDSLSEANNENKKTVSDTSAVNSDTHNAKQTNIAYVPSTSTGTVNTDGDYEGTLIGLLMTKPDPRLYEVREILPDPSYFADPIHRTTYGILLKLMNADSIPGSLQLFAEALYTNSQEGSGIAFRKKFATKLDALKYVNSVTHPDAYTTATAHIDYAKFIRWEADKREMSSIIDDVRGKLPTIPFEDREEFTSKVEERIASISTKVHDRVGLHHISDSTSSTLNTITLLHSGQLLTASIKTGIHALDRKIGGFNPGEVIVLAGRPGAGKTALAFQITLNVAQGHAADTKETVDPKTVFLFNLEMMEEQISDRLTSNISRVSLDLFKKNYETLIGGGYTGALKDRVERRLDRQFQRASLALKYINNLPIELTAQSGLTPTTIKSMIQQKKRELERTGAPELGLVVIDYLQLLAPSTKQQSRETEVADTSKRIKQMAKECDVPILLLSQLNRDADTDEMPDLKNLRESGSIEQDADKVIFIWNENAKKSKDDYRTQTSDENAQLAMWNKERMREKITIAKNRQGESGTVDVIFDWSYQSFTSQLGSYAADESFDDFFEKYYRKTRSGDDLFWPLTEEKIPPELLDFRKLPEPELPYLLANNTLYSYSNGRSSTMRINDKEGRYDNIDIGFESIDDDESTNIEYDDDSLLTDDEQTDNNTETNISIENDDLDDDTPWDNELGDDTSENRIGKYDNSADDDDDDNDDDESQAEYDELTRLVEQLKNQS